MSISDSHNCMRETHNIGRETRERVLHYAAVPALTAFGLEAVGWVEAGEGYRHVRPDPPLGLLYVCLDGWGEVWEAGRWRRCERGQAYLAPRHRAHAYRVAAGRSWKNCWALVRDEVLIGVSQPTLGNASGQALYRAIQGLASEDAGAAEPAMMERWVEMIAHYARRIGRSGETAGRLSAVWERVLADPAYPWTMNALAWEASLSEESVRRICVREMGRAPMEHVTYLRMRSAASLLASHPYTLAEVSVRIGYASPYTFSAAFKRALGVSPSEHRRRMSSRGQEQA